MTFSINSSTENEGESRNIVLRNTFGSKIEKFEALNAIFNKYRKI